MYHAMAGLTVPKFRKRMKTLGGWPRKEGGGMHLA